MRACSDHGWAVSRAALTAVLGLTLLGSCPSPAAAQPGSPLLPAVPVLVVETRPDINRGLDPVRPVFLRPGRSASRLPTITVDSDIAFQRVLGFGGTMTDTSAWLIHQQLPPGTRDLLMQALFSTKVGIGLRFLRIPVGGSDFTVEGTPYTYDDQPPGQTDPDLAGFSIGHDLRYIIPTLRQALQIDPSIGLFATPWSAPAWMKSDDSFSNRPVGTGTLQPNYFATYAQYFVKFLQAYRAAGIPVGALSVQNEPTAPTFPGQEMDAQDEGTFISSDLVPALNAAGLGSVRIWGWDSGGERDYPEQLLSGPSAADLAGIAWHCYGGLADMLRLADEYPEVDQIISECSPGIIPYSPGEALIDSVRHGAAVAALFNLALDPQGGPVATGNPNCPNCTGLVTISEATHTVQPNLDYYEVGQLSKFVAPGALRIASTRLVTDFANSGGYGTSAGVDDVAFRNPDGGLVVVAHNSGDWTRFRLSWDHRSLAYTMAPDATVTFTWYPR